jgi:peptidoglycan hydrolase-like protein with peptidoglycan-binding domain
LNHGPTLQVGSHGNDVARLQRILVMMKLLVYTGIDGSYGPVTRQSVIDFQEGAGLAADGVCGPLTWAALPADPDTPQLARGSSGAEVSALQQGLVRIGGAVSPGPVDGEFGPRTDASVRDYQKSRSIAVDGIVGNQTWWVPAGAAGATLASLCGLVTV